MRFVWHIESEDVRAVEKLIAAQKENAFFRQRIRKNVAQRPAAPTKSTFWMAAVSCLITTQQRSGPNSNVQKLILAKPFPLSHDLCSEKGNCAEYYEQVLSHYGLRRWNKISGELQHLFANLEEGLWGEVSQAIEALLSKRSRQGERKAVQFVAEDGRFKGFGPKQSRNLFQSLGLTKYEIPIDSRIIKWLRSCGFPVPLSSQALSDEEYYCFVLDGIHELCRKADVYPCELDAAIFSSFDKDEWPEDNIVW